MSQDPADLWSPILLDFRRGDLRVTKLGFRHRGTGKVVGSLPYQFNDGEQFTWRIRFTDDHPSEWLPWTVS